MQTVSHGIGQTDRSLLAPHQSGAAALAARAAPIPGNVLFALLIVSGLLWAQSAGAIAYQGRLADADGTH